MKQNYAKIAKIINKTLPSSFLKLTNKDIENFRNVGEVILGVAMLGGVLSLGLVAPNALKLVNTAKWARKTYRSLATKKNDQKKKIQDVIYYLKRFKYIELMPQGEDFLLKITEKGEEKIKHISFRGLSLPKVKKWDGRWWLVLADIPVEFHSAINAFRKKIKEMGMFTLQKSVWAYPFNPRDEIAFLAKYYNLDQFLTIIETHSMEYSDEAMLTNHFKKLGLIK